MPDQIPFPRHLLSRTPATIRVAFDRAGPDHAVVETGDLANINISSILTRIIQTVGRFSERWSSDALCEIDDIRTLCDNIFPVEENVDEIFVVGVRKDGVDGNSFVMSQLEKTTNNVYSYCHAEPYYRAVLAVNVKVKSPETSQTHRPHVTCELRDITTHFLTIDPADKDADGHLLTIPYANGNPIPAEPHTIRVDNAREHVIAVHERGSKTTPSKLTLIRVMTPDDVDDVALENQLRDAHDGLIATQDVDWGVDTSVEATVRQLCENKRYSWSYVTPSVDVEKKGAYWSC